MKIISLGEVLWDIVGDQEHLGGAPFNFAVNARRLGHEVFFVSAVGDDERGDRILSRMAELGLYSRYVRRVANLPTGTVSVTVDRAGQPSYVIHRPAAYDVSALDEDQAGLESLVSPPPDWIYYGTLQNLSPASYDALLKVLAAAPAARRFYDVNLRRDSHHPALLRDLLRHASVLKLNYGEVDDLRGALGIGGGSLEQFCRDCAAAFPLETVCVTRGAEGCVLLSKDYVESPGYRVPVADAIGAGDAFSAALVHGIGAAWPAEEIADFANRVGALVAGRRGGTPEWSMQEALTLERNAPHKYNHC